VRNFEVPGTYYNHPIPQGGKVLGISINFIDDINNSMFDWAKEWLNPFGEVQDDLSSIVKLPGQATQQFGFDLGGALESWKFTDKTKCVKTIGEQLKQIVVSKLDNQMNTLISNRYLVIPDGTLTFTGDSDDGLHIYDLKMLKVEILDSKKSNPFPRFDLITKKTAGVIRRFT
jgi:hypothetical protein